MYYTYLLFNTKTRKFYIGFTSDLVKRYEQHLAGNNGVLLMNLIPGSLFTMNLIGANLMREIVK